MAKKDEGFIASGTMHISIFSAALGLWLGWREVGNVSAYDLTPKTDPVIRESYQEGTSGSALETVYIGKQTEVKYTFNTMTAQNLALALSSSLSEGVVVDAGTVTDEASIAWHNQKVRLNNRYASSLVLSTPEEGTGALYTTDDVGYPIGSTVINLITGTGTVLGVDVTAKTGDTITFAGDTTLYAVKTGITAAGSITLMSGLKQAIPAATTAMTIRAAITTLSATTDYTQDSLNSHFVDILSTGVIADGGLVLAAYSYAGKTMDVLLSGITSFNARVEINGKNAGKNGKKYTMYSGNNTFTASNGFSFLGKPEFAEVEISGIANIDQDPDSPAYNHAYATWFNEVPVA